MSELAFLFVNASIVCFIASYVLLKVFKSKLLLICFVASPFVLIPALEGVWKQWSYGYLFILQYGGLGIALGILLFEVDQIKRAKKLRFFTSFLAKILMIFPSLYIFFYIGKLFILENDKIKISIDYASAFGFIGSEDTAMVEYIGSYFNLTGVIISTAIIVLCLLVLLFNKYSSFKEIQRI